VRREFTIERQGRKCVLYAGLLDLAHQSGLKTIRTELLSVPSAENGQTAICMATATLEKEGRELTFTGIGDASPRNVAKGMETCLIRMAETRAKARALRDAVNVGVVAFEELGGEEGEAQTSRKASAVRREGGILPSQKSKLEFLCAKLGEPLPGGLENLTNLRAEQIIAEKQKRVSEGRVA
jgi:hypothetical protein